MRLTRYIMVALAAIGGAAGAYGDLLPNGGFEADPAGTQVTGTDYIDTTTFTGWRAFAVVGAGATYTVNAAAARSGLVGMEMAYDIAGADSALDMDDPSLRVPIPAEQRIYRQLVDVRDGGMYGGSPTFTAGFQFATAGYGNTIDPAAAWETTGLTGRSDTGGYVSVRYDMNMAGGIGKSLYLDNARVEDVTYSDRMVNGGFENSDTRVLDWRFFAAGGATGSATLDSDAYAGDSAVLLERTAVDGDSGLDLWDTRLATLGGETLRIAFASKKISGDARIRISVAAWDDLGSFQGDIFSDVYDPGTVAYEDFVASVGLHPNTASVSIAFRVLDETHAPALGAYLIDGVTVMPEPSTLALLGGCVALVAARRRHR